jgi:hypothetical protein
MAYLTNLLTEVTHQNLLPFNHKASREKSCGLVPQIRAEQRNII